MDISEFYSSFFEEADELLTEMERSLLDLDPANPDSEQVNAIFRAAHSIKGGAGTFGFNLLQQTTHLLENLLDSARRHELVLTHEIIDTFLKTKDVLTEQVDAYRRSETPEHDDFEAICRLLKGVGSEDAPAVTAATPPPQEPAAAQAVEQLSTSENRLIVELMRVAEGEIDTLVDELRNLGEIIATHTDEQGHLVVDMATSVSPDDIEAVLCFVIDPDQLRIRALSAEPARDIPGLELFDASPSSAEGLPVGEETPSPAAAKKASVTAIKKAKKATETESTSIRVPVDKVDQIINLVGELIITQSMLNETANSLDRGVHGALHHGMNALQRNARDLQEAVMSIRMLPMDYVFSRFPRLVRDLAGKLDKEIELVTVGESTELDKGLTERIIDPLTHLVRNSLDHGIEKPDVRESLGKPRAGTLTLSARHQGGNILIEVSDDGGGLNRQKILAKAKANGLSVSEDISDEEAWQLIFAPGFSTAEAVSDLSGRGVGMDVVKRNIQSMGGHVEILSREGAGTTTRIVLPLTLAILDGMSVKVGGHVYILPVSSVIESLQIRQENLHTVSGGIPLLKVRGEYFPVVSIARVMGLAGGRDDIIGSIAVMVEGEGRRYVLLVDELVGQQQVVVKNLESNYRKIPGVSAATILGDGSVALILDLGEIYRLNLGERKPRLAKVNS
ncbi:chemotaxis protein CheA [Porticoccus sp.]